MANPTTTPRGALRLLYRADDDHGVANAEAKIRPGRGRAMPAFAAPPIAVRAAGDRRAAKRRDRKMRAARTPQDKTDPLARAAGHAAAIVARQREARRRPCHPRPDCPSLGRTQGAHDAGRPRPGRPGRHERAVRVRSAGAQVFTKPLAKAVVEQRKALVREPDSTERVDPARSTRSPSAVRRSTRTVSPISPCATFIGG